MGSVFGNLTHSAVVNPDGTIQWNASPAASGQNLATAQSKQVQPASADVTGDGTSFSTPQTPFSKLAKPSMQEAAQMGATPGGVNAMSPGLTKMGKLATLLTSGMQGALAGRAASEQAVIQSGGHRSGGAGLGFQAGYTLPWQRAEQQSQAQLAQAGTQPIQTPYGQMPMAMASKILTPYLGYQGKVQAAQIGGQAREQVAQTGAQAHVQAAQIGGQAKENVARIEQGMALPVDETVANLAGIPELAGQKVGKGTWENINKSLQANGYHTQDMGENGPGQNQGMWLMDRAGNRIKQISDKSLMFQRGYSFAANRPEVVTDPNDPGYAYYTSAAQAMQQNLPSPQGAGTQAAKTAARSEVPTKIGDQKVAFNTAMQHAQLLEQAATALSNGDVRMLNSVKNKFKTAFGSADVTNFQVISNAYSREITKMLSAGHMTDSEIASAGGTLPANASPQQILGAVQSYRNLAQSKLNMLNQQKQSATAPTRPQGEKPNAPTRTIIF